MPQIHLIKRDGRAEAFSQEKFRQYLGYAVAGLSISLPELEEAAYLQLFDGMHTHELNRALMRAASGLTSRARPDYTYVAARFLLQEVKKEVTNGSIDYPHLADYLYTGVEEEQLDAALIDGRFNLLALNEAIVPERDLAFDYLGLKTLSDRYFIRRKAKPDEVAPIIELPQHFFMRVAMGLALNEDNPTARAIEFYTLYQQHDFLSSTPTLFNAGTRHSQLSSCYLNTVADSLSGIYGTITECAQLSKWAGGIGTDWTRVRPSGAIIYGTNGKSSGPIPYLKVYNDTAVAVNQGGKRQGSFAPYLETWHPDMIAFAELKKNSGDERLRAHDIFPANWIPDLFMQRVQARALWSFFDPSEYPELHELYGADFEARYTELEATGHVFGQMPAFDLWKKMLTMLFETGHPWITFKDPCNTRNPQDHVGVVHNSNLCTEITLNTSDSETAVCNLGSVVLPQMLNADGSINHDKLRRTIRTAVRMLDNVIDINFYPSGKAENSNLQHRPVGLGVMGYFETLVMRGIDWESEAHYAWADELFEAFSYYAIEASSDLAVERGAYPTFVGSKWSRGILPIDTAKHLDYIGRTPSLNWQHLREKVAIQGMRNSNVMAIAPTATISNILNREPCIEPPFALETVKGNLAGEYTVVTPALRHGRPDLVRTVWDVSMVSVIKAAAVRQKWLDQAQSTNLWMRADKNARDLHEWYMLAWELGLKTTYYLRQPNNALAKRQKELAEKGYTLEEAAVCSLDNPEACEACQ